MLTKEQYDAMKAKKPDELTDEEKSLMTEFEKAQTDDKNKVPSTWEEIFKHPRFKELAEKAKSASDALEQFKQEQLNKETDAMKAANNFKGLYEQTLKQLDELKPKAALVDSSEKVLQDVLTAQIAELPEAARALVPDEMTVQQKLNWLAKNKSTLMKPAPFDIGAGKGGGAGGNTGAEGLTQEEIETAKNFGLKPEEYAKYKDKPQT